MAVAGSFGHTRVRYLLRHYQQHLSIRLNSTDNLSRRQRYLCTYLLHRYLPTPYLDSSLPYSGSYFLLCLHEMQVREEKQEQKQQ